MDSHSPATSIDIALDAPTTVTVRAYAYWYWSFSQARLERREVPRH